MTDVVQCPECGAARAVRPDQRTAGCFRCGRRLALGERLARASAASDEAARALVGEANRGARLPRGLAATREEPALPARLAEAVRVARSARGERNRLRALADALLNGGDAFSLDEFLAAARVLGIPPGTAQDHLARRADLFQPRPGVYRLVQ